MSIVALTLSFPSTWANDMMKLGIRTLELPGKRGLEVASELLSHILLLGKKKIKNFTSTDYYNSDAFFLT